MLSGVRSAEKREQCTGFSGLLSRKISNRPGLNWPQEIIKATTAEWLLAQDQQQMQVRPPS